MYSSRQNMISVRAALGILVGASASILLISTMRNYILATILGMLVAMIISGRSTPVEFAVYGFLTGSIGGLYMGAGDTITWSEVRGLNMLVAMLFTGFLCAGYGYFTGKMLILFKQGRGPFF